MDEDANCDVAGGADLGSVADLQFAEIPAQPESLVRLRRVLSEWVTRIGMTEEQKTALTLASYEALANAASHAYPDGSGVLGLCASHQPDSARVEVTVFDHGNWRTPPFERGGLGGRGLLLIESLADHAEVITDDSGTIVRMVWTTDVRSTAKSD